MIATNAHSLVPARNGKAALVLALCAGLFIAAVAARATPLSPSPAPASAPAASAALFPTNEITRLVKELEYPDTVARDLISLVGGWKDAHGHPVVTVLRQSLAQAKQEAHPDRPPGEALARVEQDAVKRLTHAIRRHISTYNVSAFELTHIIKQQQAQCLSFTLLFHILGNAIGLSVGGVETEVMRFESRGPLPGSESTTINGHEACVVHYANGTLALVDLTESPSRVMSKPFVLEEFFQVADGYWQRKRGDTPAAWPQALATARRVDLRDARGLLADLCNNRGTVLRNSGRNLEAISEHNKAIALNPKYSAAYNNRGAAYLGMGRQAEALRDYSKAIELNPQSPLAYYNRAKLHRSSGRYIAAISDYTKVIEIIPECPEAYNGRGVARVSLNQHTEALEDFGKAIEFNPKYAEAHFNRGMAHADLGRRDLARKDLRKAVELNPAGEAAVKAVLDKHKLNP